MPKKLLLLSFLFHVATPAISSPTVIQVPMICVSKTDMAQTLGDFDEEPLMTMVTVREFDNKPVEIKTVLFANSKTRTWTLVEQIGDSYCALSAGSGINPYYSR